MNIEEARQVYLDRDRWHSILSAERVSDLAWIYDYMCVRTYQFKQFQYKYFNLD